MSENQKPKVRKALFIGLGGTGEKTLRQLKKRFFEVYGHCDPDGRQYVPDFVKFLLFDTDRESAFEQGAALRAYNTQAKKEMSITFQGGEVVGLAAPGSKAKILSQEKQNQDLYSWLPTENFDLLQDLNDLRNGAGQIRLFGRIGLFENAQAIHVAIAKAIGEITNADLDNDFFDPFDSEDSNFALDVNIVSSIAGGTGAGMFMDVAMMVQDILTNGRHGLGSNKGRVRGFFVLPDVFLRARLDGNFDNVMPNAAAALQEIDFFQGFMDPATVGANRDVASRMKTFVWSGGSPINESEDKEGPIKIKYSGLEIPLKRKPFDDVFVVGNQNKIGNFNKVTDLTDSLAKSMFVNTTTLANQLLKKEDNIKGSALPFKGKESFLGGVGVSEMVYNSHETRRHLALRFASEGFEVLLKEVDEGIVKQKAADFAETHYLNQDGTEGGVIGRILLPARNEDELDVRLLREDLEDEGDPNDILAQLRDSIQEKDFPEMKAMAQEIVTKTTNGLARLSLELGETVSFTKEHALVRTVFSHHLEKAIEHIQGNLDGHFKSLVAEAKGALLEVDEEIGEFMAKNFVMRKLSINSLDKAREKWQITVRALLAAEIKLKACDEATTALRTIKTTLQKTAKNLGELEDGMRVLAEGVKQEIRTRSQGSIADRKPVPFTENLHVPDMMQAIDLSMFDLGAFHEEMVSMWENHKWSGQASDVAYASRKEELLKAMTDLNIKTISDIRDDALAPMMMDVLEEASIIEGNIEGTRAGKLLDDLFKRSEPLTSYSLPSILNERNLGIDQSLKELFSISVPTEELKKALEVVIAKTDHAQRQYSIEVVPLEKDRVSAFCKQWAAPIMALSKFDEYIDPYTEFHQPKTGKVYHVNYNWVEAMERSNYDPRQSSASNELVKLEWFVKALVMGWIAWQPEKRYWKIDTSNEDIKVIRNEKRTSLFGDTMMNYDLAEEFQGYWNGLLGNVAEIKSKFQNAAVRDGNNWDVSGYLQNPNVNRYYKSINPARKEGQFGTRYGGVQGGPNERRQLKEEVEILKKLAADVEQDIFS